VWPPGARAREQAAAGIELAATSGVQQGRRAADEDALLAVADLLLEGRAQDG